MIIRFVITVVFWGIKKYYHKILNTYPTILNFNIFYYDSKSLWLDLQYQNFF